MNQPTGLNTLMRDCVSNTTSSVTNIMMLEMMFTVFPAERERFRETLSHEPTYEDLSDCCQFLGERLLDPKCLQRAIDREKIRRLVLGDSQAFLTLRQK